MRAAAACGVFLALGVGCSGANRGEGSPPSAGGSAAGTAPSSPTAAPDGAPRSDALAGTAWRAVEADAAATPGSTPTLTFDSPQHASGSTGCNRFSGSIAMDGGALRFGPLLTTRRGCPAPVMEREKRFLGALEACRSWRRAPGSGGGQALELLDESGTVVLRLEAAPENPPPS